MCSRWVRGWVQGGPSVAINATVHYIAMSAAHYQSLQLQTRVTLGVTCTKDRAASID